VEVAEEYQTPVRSAAGLIEPSKARCWETSSAARLSTSKIVPISRIWLKISSKVSFSGVPDERQAVGAT
jgi:hypothetical protein